MPLVLVAALIIVAGLAFWVQRRDELFHLSVRDGRVLVVRGRIPSGLLQDFKDVMRGVDRATIRVALTANGGRLVATGVPEGTSQRLRNIFQLCPQSLLRSAPAISNPSIGQILGVASLAWLLSR